MSRPISVVASVLATCTAIAVAQGLYGASDPEGQSRNNRLEITDQPSDTEITMRAAAARGLLAYSGIQLAYPEAGEAGTTDRSPYGAF
jgi:hypothetical protein